MNKFTLIFEYCLDDLEASNISKSSQARITHEFSAVCLDEVLPEIRNFLRGAGYEIDGDIRIADKE
ncbi:MAG: hypothetical protein EBZ78_02195 [Verrucomicrobia bacterium]|nr:hypothetical protein [Verrucomicrobiota bacterium]